MVGAAAAVIKSIAFPAQLEAATNIQRQSSSKKVQTLAIGNQAKWLKVVNQEGEVDKPSIAPATEESRHIYVTTLGQNLKS